MFSIDEIDVDFNDETFDVLNRKSNVKSNQSDNKGVLSYGVSMNDNKFESVISSKRKCLGGHLSNTLNILDRSNDTENISEYKEKLANSQQCVVNKVSNTNIFSEILSPAYSPITSTQIDADSNKLGCLFDRSNEISPIKMKPGICSELRKPSFNFDSKQGDSNLVTRKFPGPAGSLPKVVSGHGQFPSLGSLKAGIMNNTTQIKSNIDRDLNTFSTSHVGESYVWKRARAMIGDHCWKYFQKYTLDNVFKMLSDPRVGLPNSKIPIICLVITDIEYLTCDAAAKLTDKTGSIGCAVHRQVLENYKDSIKAGSVFILKKVSIFSPSGKKYYLNVTQSNVIDILNPDPTEQLPFTSQSNLISQSAIDTIVKECSETPKIIFNAKTAFEELAREPVPPQPQPQSIPPTSKVDFDDDLDDVFLSLMEELE